MEDKSRHITTHQLAILLLLLGLLLPLNTKAQETESLTLYEPVDSVDIAYYGKQRPWQTSAMVVGVNLGVWAFDRYIMHEPFAYISPETIKENITYGFVWDNDKWGTNMFMHPYHGNLYYNAARSNGYNYLQSGLFALAGSAMWEVLMENEHPSINDIITTPIGGMIVGEMTYRASDLILDDRAQGVERFVREASSFIVSPMRGLTRIINGDAWNVRTTSGRQFGIPDIKLQFSTGVRSIHYRNNINDHSIGFASELMLEYGDKFSDERQRLFDYFTVRGNLNIQASQPALGRVNISGRLHGRNIINDDKHHRLNLAIYQTFDYFDSDTISLKSAKVPYRICAPAAFGGGLTYQYRTDKNDSVDAFIGWNGIILGGALCDYYNVYKRNYNLGSGFSIKASINAFLSKGRVNIGASHGFYRLFTWKGYPDDVLTKPYTHKTLNAQGTESQTSFHITELRADVKVIDRLYLTASMINFARHTHYIHHPSVTSSTTEARLMLTYRL